ncbi:MAG: cellulase family glycosylhydrolase [Candidatus Aenigmarchaeota archaeon]|nr:cellulase family glycosylhydrolase [Candidatus Aenigmarchaeota archaeon]
MMSIKKRIALILIAILLIYVLYLLISLPSAESIIFKGFGWYGYLADDEVNEEVLERIKVLGGNSVNINVYYEYNPENESFILLSNLTKIEEKINLIHKHDLIVFLSPFVNLVGGNYTGGSIDEPEPFLKKAKNISIDLARFAQKNNVQIYALWNELGLSIHKVQNHINLTNQWLQDVRREVKKVYNGSITTKEGVQLGFYNYNFSGFDYIGVTYYPFTTSFAVHPGTGQRLGGVENLEEYEDVVKEEIKKLNTLKQKFRSRGIILGEIGIDVVGGKFIENDEESKKIRTSAYEIVLRNGKGKIDGFFFSKFGYEDGGSEELDEVLKYYFREKVKITTPT